MFVYKTEKEISELSEYQREKYFDQKAQYEKDQAKEIADKAAKDAVAEALKDVDSKIEDAEKRVKEEVEKEAETKITAIKDEYDRKLEEAEKAFKRVDDNNIYSAGKAVSEQVAEALKGREADLKDLLTVKGKSLRLDNIDQTKATMVVPANGVAPQYAPLVGPGHYNFYARDIIPVYNTDSDTLRYVRYTYDDTSDGIAVADENTLKKSFGYDGETIVEPLKVIAGYLKVSNQLMRNVDGFASWIGREAVLALRDEEDRQIYKGNGTTELNGLWTSSGVAPTIPGIGGSELEDVCSAITAIRENKRNATAVVVSPAKWMQIYLNKDNENAYTYPVVFDTQRGVLTLGGVPVLYSAVFGREEGLIGDFNRGAAIWQNFGIELKYAEQNEDDFIRNLVTIRVEEMLNVAKYYDDGFYRLFEATT